MLSKGTRFTFDRLQWRVAYVTASRAHCVATSTRPVTVTSADGSTRTFTATVSRTLDISPATDPALLQELGL